MNWSFWMHFVCMVVPRLFKTFSLLLKNFAIDYRGFYFCSLLVVRVIILGCELLFPSSPETNPREYKQNYHQCKSPKSCILQAAAKTNELLCFFFLSHRRQFSVLAQKQKGQKLFPCGQKKKRVLIRTETTNLGAFLKDKFLFFFAPN